MLKNVKYEKKCTINTLAYYICIVKSRKNICEAVENSM